MPKKKLIIFPFNGNGIEALDCISTDEYDFIGFVDDIRKESSHYDIYTRDILNQYREVYVLAVPGSPASFRKRQEIISSLGIDSSRFVSVIHPRASVGRGVQVGMNCLIMAGVVLTSNAQIKDHVCILPNSVVHHDAVIGDYTLIGSNVVIAGGTTIGKNCYIGSGSNIINGISIGDASLIGLGSNVLNHVKGNAKMVGNPARDLNAHIKQEVF
ncbi:UDP-perosamine 4-acetyltransferase [Pontibacter mucosus]|uniref:UDP-perosamine 4-acetyltransferase n=1 Tax=Pontibacter mucosus TaxID=1649266 RepID=A0A2T5YQ65_9BACT|nr:acetyltransferase [Pontibacter mucosus]PTX21455.1 UDP-perosamine 4-acetyltransferase [Pontibacter mucosus]